MGCGCYNKKTVVYKKIAPNVNRKALIDKAIKAKAAESANPPPQKHYKVFL